MEVGKERAPSAQAVHPPSPEKIPMGMPNQPEVVKVTFNKVKGSIGLSIVAAKVSVILALNTFNLVSNFFLNLQIA
jgi:hypothetical protein